MTPSPNSQSNSHHRYQLLEPLHGAGFNTMPLPHTIPMGAGVAAWSGSQCSMVWPLTWDEVIVAFSELTFGFLLGVKQYSTGDNSCHTGPFEDADSTISMVSLSLRHEHIWFGVTCRTRRPLRNTLHCRGWGGPKAVSSDPILTK